MNINPNDNSNIVNKMTKAVNSVKTTSNQRKSKDILSDTITCTIVQKKINPNEPQPGNNSTKMTSSSKKETPSTTRIKTNIILKILKLGHRISHFVRIFSYLSYNTLQMQQLRQQCRTFSQTFPSPPIHVIVPSRKFSTINSAVHSITNQKGSTPVEIWLRERIYKKTHPFRFNSKFIKAVIGCGQGKTIIQNTMIIGPQHYTDLEGMTISPCNEHCGPGLQIGDGSYRSRHELHSISVKNVEITNCRTTVTCKAALHVCPHPNICVIIDECSIHGNSGRGLMARGKMYLLGSIISNNDRSGLVCDKFSEINIDKNCLITKNGNGLTPNQFGIRTYLTSSTDYEFCSVNIDADITEAKKICHSNYQHSDFGGGNKIHFNDKSLWTAPILICHASPRYEGTHGPMGNCNSCGFEAFWDEYTKRQLPVKAASK